MLRSFHTRHLGIVIFGRRRSEHGLGIHVAARPREAACSRHRETYL